MDFIKHALHNEKACKFLHKEGKFNDWVITTAYYSAMKFVQGSIFPVVVENDEFENFKSYYQNHYLIECRTNGTSPSHHQALIDLFTEKHGEVGHKYQWLCDNSMNARYNQDFKLKKKLANKAIEYLEDIKNYVLEELNKSDFKEEVKSKKGKRNHLKNQLKRS